MESLLYVSRGKTGDEGTGKRDYQYRSRTGVVVRSGGYRQVERGENKSVITHDGLAAIMGETGVCAFCLMLW